MGQRLHDPDRGVTAWGALAVATCVGEPEFVAEPGQRRAPGERLSGSSGVRIDSN